MHHAAMMVVVMLLYNNWLLLYHDRLPHVCALHKHWLARRHPMYHHWLYCTCTYKRCCIEIRS